MWGVPYVPKSSMSRQPYSLHNHILFFTCSLALQANLLPVARCPPCPLVHPLVNRAIVAAQHRVQHPVQVVKRINQWHCLWSV